MYSGPIFVTFIILCSELVMGLIPPYSLNRYLRGIPFDHRMDEVTARSNLRRNEDLTRKGTLMTTLGPSERLKAVIRELFSEGYYLFS